MFTKSFKNTSFITTILVLTACGGGGDTSIASPGELGSLDDPTGGGGTGGSSSNVLTGSCPESEFITNGAIFVYIVTYIAQEQLTTATSRCPA